jgi:hypothetical protein
MLDPTTPVPGRTWYCGRWRTPEQIEKRKTATARNMKSSRYRATRSASYRRRYATDPAFRARELERNRKNYKPRVRKTRLSDEQREQRAKAKRHAAAERRREARRFRARIKAEHAKALRAPAAVRAAWSRASEGSIMRRKYPTMAALDASARRGEWDGWTA